MGRDGGRDQDGVELGISDEIAIVRGRLNGRIPLNDQVKSLVANVAHLHDACVRSLAEIPDEIRPPVTIAQHADANHPQSSLARGSPIRRAGTPYTRPWSGTS